MNLYEIVITEHQRGESKSIGTTCRANTTRMAVKRAVHAYKFAPGQQTNVTIAVRYIHEIKPKLSPTSSQR